MKAEEIFIDELANINDNDILSFVLDCFDDLCPEYFWTCPSSLTGKYHPAVSIGKGGLVRHTKLAVWWGEKLIRAFNTFDELKDISESQLKDEVVAALLMHDMHKNGPTDDSYKRCGNTTGTHGVMLSVVIGARGLGSYLPDSTRRRILIGIAGHMGQWTTDAACRPSNLKGEDQAFAQLVHVADYCASRKVDEKLSLLSVAKGGRKRE